MKTHEKLQKYAKDLRLTQTAIAAELDVSQPMVSFILNGTHEPSPKQARAIEKLTGGLIKREEWYYDEEELGRKGEQVQEQLGANGGRILPQQGGAAAFLTVKDMATGRIYHIIEASAEI